MSFSLRPQFYIKRLLSLTPEMLKQYGISLLILDLDNTVSPYDEQYPTNEVLFWCDTMKRAGIRLYFVSNSKKIRPDIFSKAMGIPFIKHAKKPSPKYILKACRDTGVDPSHAALAGDQIFTDVLGANRAGVRSILVYPIKFTNPFLALRYFVEIPFRLTVKIKL